MMRLKEPKLIYGIQQKVEVEDVKLYLHWTAGDYYTNFRDYNISINGEGGLYLSDDDLSDVLDHTYYRNSGATGITMNCAAHATPEDLGPYPPTKKQIDGMAKVICILADAFRSYY